jgi:hypothetical protein
MKNSMIRFALIGAMTVLLSACGGPTIDGKNPETFKASITKMMSDMDAKSAQKLQRDLQTISQKEIFSGKPITNLSDVAKNVQDSELRILEGLDGLTAEEIGEKADKIRKEKG